MQTRTILSIVLLVFGAFACKNEPYETVPLGVTNLLNHGVNINNVYRYRSQKIYSFLSIGADTLTYRRFHYAGDDLERIVADSTGASLKLTTLYRSAEGVIDSTFLIDATGRSLLSSRTITYDGEDNPLTVDLKTWDGSVLTERLAELTWEDGNVVRLMTYGLSNGEKKLQRDLIVGYDDQHCVYMKNNNYLFVLALDELHWLSKNNPKAFNTTELDQMGEVRKPYSYTYWYNKFGYPSNFKDETGTLYGVGYKQVH